MNPPLKLALEWVDTAALVKERVEAALFVKAKHPPFPDVATQVLT